LLAIITLLETLDAGMMRLAGSRPFISGMTMSIMSRSICPSFSRARRLVQSRTLPVQDLSDQFTNVLLGQGLKG
jgi:hypothetical protein